ncbi:MAG: hypothetical protein M1818_004381 [Claussenomyces sp. TS43310]|nr:MAG: hypothetical protein M1818_004381 [Claussenomyces sp. TS43310]
MRCNTGVLGMAAMTVAQTWAQELDYADSINALAYGNVKLQGNSSSEVWLNVTGFAPDKLPYIQDDVGLFTLDNAEPLIVVAGLAKTAASTGKWGDLVFLYNVFVMNGFADYAKVSSEQMQEGLLKAVTGKNETEPDIALVELYASTSSSEYLSEAFDNLKTKSLTKRWTSEFCSNAHKAATSACKSLIQSISGSVTMKSGGPRSICAKGCCISWSANATFQYQNLTNAANYCISGCATSKVSCEVKGVSLQGTILDQCLSNRATGCT